MYRNKIHITVAILETFFNYFKKVY
jgi:hypothetical protein